MIQQNWQGMVALTGAFIAGTVFMGTMYGFISLPDELAAQITRHDTDIEALDERVSPIEAYIANQNVLICIQVAQAQGTPVEGCTIPR